MLPSSALFATHPPVQSSALRRAFSLLELLMVILIVSILASISVMSYMGAMHAADLRASLPGIMKRFESWQEMSREKNTVIEVEFVKNTSRLRLTFRGGGHSERTELDLEKDSFLKRHPVFGGYRWPDGTTAPRTFVFYPGREPDGGEVEFGSTFATARIFIAGNRVDWEL